MRIPRKTLALLIAGTGLMLLGMMGMYLVSSWQADQTLLPTDFAAIPAAVRYEAPTLALPDLAGNVRSLADYRGQVVLVNVWATWCPPCQAEMPLLQSYYEKHRQRGFAVVGIEDGEPDDDVRAFVTRYGLTFPIWLDPTHKAGDSAFKTINLPSSYVVSRDGVVRLAWYGAISERNLEKYVTPLIEER